MQHNTKNVIDYTQYAKSYTHNSIPVAFTNYTPPVFKCTIEGLGITNEYIKENNQTTKQNKK